MPKITRIQLQSLVDYLNKSDETIKQFVAMKPLIEELVEQLADQDPERGLTLRAPDPAALDALVRDIRDIARQFFLKDCLTQDEYVRALRERLGG